MRGQVGGMALYSIRGRIAGSGWTRYGRDRRDGRGRTGGSNGQARVGRGGWTGGPGSDWGVGLVGQGQTREADWQAEVGWGGRIGGLN